MQQRTIQVGVKAFLENPEGKYLLAKRSSEKYPEVGAKWDIIGGRIEPGGSLQENLRREILEEVGLKLTEVPTLLYAQDILAVPDRHIVRLTYHAFITGNPVVDQEEHTDAQWFTLEEIQSLPPHEKDEYLMEIIERGILMQYIRVAV